MNTLLIIGCGSIGARHARNAISLGLSVVLVDPDVNRAHALADEIGATGVFASYEETASASIDAVVVASPSSFHIEAVRFFLERSIPVFIEKPLATSVEGLEGLVDLAKENGVVTMMGQSYRFHETFMALKTFLDEGAVGRIYHAQFFGGQYLPDWHPQVDYRTEYMAQKRQGGGVMLTSKSHTLDFIEWFFGPIKEYVGWKDQLGSLTLDVDDACFLLMKTERDIVAYAQFDFLERPHRSRAIIAGEAGTIDADFIADTITVTRADGTAQTHSYNPDPNARYVEELRYFATLVEKGESDPTLDIAHGKHIVDLMLDPRVRDLTHGA